MEPIEQRVITYLNTALAVPAYAEIPAENIPEKFVVVEKTGSGEQNKLFEASIAVQSYAQSLHDASMLNETVKSKMAEIIGEASITACKLNSDYNFTDTRTKRYRYQAIFNILHY